MKFALTFMLLFSAQSAMAIDTSEHLARLAKMVQSGVITEEAAQAEEFRVKDPRHQSLEQRGEAQRSLASVNPSLKPLKIKRLKAIPMELWLD